jgi:NAD+ synthase (glutamine-hydrolysing)
MESAGCHSRLPARQVADDSRIHKPLRIGLGQFNPALGDFAGNIASMRKIYEKALGQGLDLLVFGELSVCGYPPEDLLLKEHFLQDNYSAVKKLAAECTEMTVVAGFAEGSQGACYNAAAIMAGGRIEKVYRKRVLPNYGVFDEKRYFQGGAETVAVDIKGIHFIVTICEDIWQGEQLQLFLEGEPKNKFILNISASPFHIGKIKQRQEILSRCAEMFSCPVGYCNIIGGQDELVFDGRSMFVDSAGGLISCAKAFEEDLLIAEFAVDENSTIQLKADERAAFEPVEFMQEVYPALVLGTRDYVRKNGFEKVVVGLSGGIDSSVTAAIAVAALGAENVTAVTMPSNFNRPETIADAVKQARNLDIRLLTIPIEPCLNEFHRTLSNVTGWDRDGIAYENLQARIRGCILMALSNQFGWMVLTTGNKSETAVGYATLYGDTAGGFAVIKDVPKTMVYQIAEYINRTAGREVIPPSVIKRQPTAELRANQKDTDSLPDYELLDEILKAYVEQDKSARQLVEQGLAAEEVNRVVRMVDHNEYKRRQSPPGIKITPKAFGRDRRLPITSRYADQTGF